MNPPPVSSQAAARSLSLTETVYETLRADILACRLVPGRKLKIGELCTQLGVSLGAVREALSRLAAEGFVLAEAQRGFQVAPVSAADLADLTRTRIEIESLAMRHATALGNVKWEAGIVATFHQFSRVPERDPTDPARLNDEWVDLHEAFHAALVEACDSVWLKRLRAVLYAQSERYRRLSVPVRRGKRNVVGEHRAIMDAVLARDADRGCALMAEHLSLTTRILLEAGITGDVKPAGTTAAARLSPRHQRVAG